MHYTGLNQHLLHGDIISFETITQRLGYKFTIADPDVYIKAKEKLDGKKNYSYLIIYVDDVL